MSLPWEGLSKLRVNSHCGNWKLKLIGLNWQWLLTRPQKFEPRQWSSRNKNDHLTFSTRFHYVSEIYSPVYKGIRYYAEKNNSNHLKSGKFALSSLTVHYTRIGCTLVQPLLSMHNKAQERYERYLFPLAFVVN